MQEFRLGFDPTPLHATDNYFTPTDINDVTYEKRVRARYINFRSILEPGAIARAIDKFKGVSELAIALAAIFDVDRDRRQRARRHLMMTAPYALNGAQVTQPDDFS